jgi:hypothetical protein
MRRRTRLRMGRGRLRKSREPDALKPTSKPPASVTELAEHFLRRDEWAAAARAGGAKIRALFGEERSARLDRDVTSGPLSANAQEPGADRALDLFEGPAEHLGGLVEREPLARTEDTRRALPRAHHRHRPPRIPTHLHAHAITMPFLPKAQAPTHQYRCLRYAISTVGARSRGLAVPPRARRRPRRQPFDRPPRPYAAHSRRRAW